MKVRVRFFSHLRDLVGDAARDVDLADGATVADLIEKLYAQTSALRAHDKNILVGAGVEFVDRKHQLQPGEEIAIMPPVQGG